MRTDDEIEKIADKLSQLRDKWGRDEENAWRCKYLTSQIEVLDWILGYQEAEDIFDSEALE